MESTNINVPKFKIGDSVYRTNSSNVFDNPTVIMSITIWANQEPEYGTSYGRVKESTLRTKGEQIIFLQAELVKFIQS